MLGPNSPPKRGFVLIECQIRGRFTTTPPDHPPIALGDIPCTIQIGVEGMSTHMALEESLMPGGLAMMAPVTLLTCETEEKSAYKVLDQRALSNPPLQVLFKTFQDFNEELDPSIQGREGEHGPALSNRGTSWEIVANRQRFGHLGFRFSAFGQLQGLFDDITSQLGGELEPLSNGGIGQGGEGVPMCDLVLPCYGFTKLDGLEKDMHGLPEEVRTVCEFHFRRNHGFHTFIWIWDPELKNLTAIPPPLCRGGLLEVVR